MEVTDTLLSALLALQREAPALPKDGTNPHFKSKFTKLDTIVETIGPLLTKHGLIWTALPTSDEAGRPALNYRLIHARTGETLEGTMPLMVAKESPQEMGSALTYSRRYSITAVLNLVADEDDDGNKASNRAEKKAASNGDGPRLATPKDVEEMVTAAKGLEREQIKLALAACGIADAPTYNKVPAEKVAPLVKQLVAMERE